MMPVAVVVRGCRGDPVGRTGLCRTEGERPAVGHRDLSAHGGRVAAPARAERDQRSAGRRGRLEPPLEGVVLRRVELRPAGHDTVPDEVDRRLSGEHTCGRSHRAGRTDVVAVVLLDTGIGRHGQRRVLQSVIQDGLVGVDRCAVRIGRRRLDGGRPPARCIVRRDPVGTEDLELVHRGFVDRAVEVGVGRCAREAGETVAADAPHAVVVPTVLDGREVVDQHAVDVHAQTGVTERADDMVPSAVVQRGRAGHRVAVVRVDTEQHTTVVRHVHVAVEVAVRGGSCRRPAEADDPSTLGRGGADPRLERERVDDRAQPTRAVLGDSCVGRSVEGVGRVAGFVQERTGDATGDAAVHDAVVMTEPVGGGSGGTGRFCEAPLERRPIGHHCVRVGTGCAARRDDHRDRVRPGRVAGAVRHPHAIRLGRAGREPDVGVADRLPIPEGRRRADRRDRVRDVVVADEPVLELTAVTVPVRRHRDADLTGSERTDLRHEQRAAQTGALTVRGDRRHGEPHQPLLLGVVDPQELAADDEVLRVALGSPSRHAGARDRAGLPFGEPVGHRGARPSGEVDVVPRVGTEHALRSGRHRRGVAHVVRPGL